MRIDWDPLDVAVATLVGGVVRIHEGTSVREHSRDVLDMRWLADGPIMTITTHDHVMWTRDDRLIADHPRGSRYLQTRSRLIEATIAAGGERYAVIETRGDVVGFTLAVETVPPREIFRHAAGALDQDYRSSLAISGDGRRVAIGFVLVGSGRRGFAVFDVDSSTALDRGWSEPAVDKQRLALDLDYRGARLAQALPDASPALGAIRVGMIATPPARHSIGGATAVALDRTGELAAYAYREVPPGARGRLRFDYLDPQARGEVLVDILDTQTLESELPDLVALAFSRDRRRLACLSSTGAIEIVPVP
jgi:hypothetical protein